MCLHTYTHIGNYILAIHRQYNCSYVSIDWFSFHTLTCGLHFTGVINLCLKEWHKYTGCKLIRVDGVLVVLTHITCWIIGLMARVKFYLEFIPLIISTAILNYAYSQMTKIIWSAQPTVNPVINYKLLLRSRVSNNYRNFNESFSILAIIPEIMLAYRPHP